MINGYNYSDKVKIKITKKANEYNKIIDKYWENIKVEIGNEIIKSLNSCKSSINLSEIKTIPKAKPSIFNLYRPSLVPFACLSVVPNKVVHHRVREYMESIGFDNSVVSTYVYFPNKG